MTTREVGIRLKVGADGLPLVDALAREIEALGGDAQAATAKAAALAAELDRLGAERAAIESFRQQRAAVLAAGEALDATRAKAEQLGREIAATNAPAEQQAAAFERASAAAREAQAAYAAESAALERLRPSLAAAGVATDGLAVDTQQLDTRAQALAAELDRLGQARGAVEQFQRQQTAVRAAGEAMQATSVDAQRLGAEITATAAPTQAQAAAFERAAAAARTADAAYVAEVAALDQLRPSLAAAGVATDVLAGDTEQLGARAQALASELEQLGQERGAIEQFQRQQQAVQAAGVAMERAGAQAQQLGREIAASTAPTQAQVAAFERANAEVRESEAAYDAARAGLQQLTPALASAGVAADGLTAAEARNQAATTATRAAAAALTQEIEQQASAFRDGIGQFERQSRAMQEAGLAAQVLDTQLERLRAEIAASTAPTQAQATAMERVTTAARLAREQFNAERVALEQLRAQLAATGVSADALAAAEARVRTQTAAVRDAVAQATSALRNEAAAYRQVGEAAAASGAKQTAVAQAAQQAFSGVQSQLQTIQRIAGVAIGGGIFTSLLKDAADTADEMRNLQARIRLVTGEGPAFQAAFEGVTQIALRTNSSLDATATLFTRVAAAGREIGVGQEQALALTETINQAIQISGSSATASNAAIVQLVQGLQSGVLRGEEFNSVMEQAPRLADALAAGLGVARGQLRGLAEDGQLTSAVVIRALQSQRQAVESEFGRLPQTVGRALQNLSTEWSLFVDRLDRGTGATVLVAQGIGKLADNLDTVARVAAVVGTALTVNLALAGVAALRKLSEEMLGASGNANVLSKSIKDIPRIVNVAIAFTGFEIGLQIGDKLRENSVLARQFGLAVSDLYQGIVNNLIFLKEAAAAVFSDDTIGAALDRFQQRLDQQRATTTRLLDQAAKSGLQLRQEAEQNAEFSARAAERVGAAGVKTGQDINAGAAVGSRALGSLGSAGAAAGVQVAAGGGIAAAGLGRVGQAGQTALGALQALASSGNVATTLGPNLEQVAEALVRVTLRGGDAQRVIGTELPQAIAKLSGPELLQFRTAVVGALEESIRASQRLAEQQRATGESFSESLADAQAAGALLEQVLLQVGQQAAQALGVEAVAAGNRVGQAFRTADDNLQVLLRSLPALQRAGVDTGNVVSAALAKMIDGARTRDEIDIVIDRVNALGAAGEITQVQINALFDTANDKVRALAQQIEDATPGIQSLGEAARRVGADFEELTTGISEGFARSVDDIAALSEEMDKAGVAADRAGPALEKAIDQKIAAADTKEELELLAEAVELIGDKSQITERQASGMLDRIKAKAAELSPAMRQLAEDAALLGVKIDTSARPSVERLSEAYQRMKASGLASASELQQAFVRYAQAAIDAAGGLIPPTIAAEAAMRGLSIEADATGRAIIKAAGDGASAMDRLSSAAGRARDAINQVSDASSSLTQRNAQISADSIQGDIDRSNRNADANQNLANDPFFELLARQRAGTLGPEDLATAQAVVEAFSNNLQSAQASLTAFDPIGFQQTQAQFNQARAILDSLSGRGFDGAGGTTTGSRGLVGAPPPPEPAPPPPKKEPAPEPPPPPPPSAPVPAPPAPAPAPAPREPIAPAPPPLAPPPPPPAPPPPTAPVPIAPQVADRIVRVELTVSGNGPFPLVGTEQIVDSFLQALEDAQRSAGVVGGA